MPYLCMKSQAIFLISKIKIKYGRQEFKTFVRSNKFFLNLFFIIKRKKILNFIIILTCEFQFNLIGYNSLFKLTVGV
jgi:hypothetical protein